MTLSITDHICKNDEETIYAELLKYNLSHLKNEQPKDLAVYFKNENGKLYAGLIGSTHCNWLTIKYLWVSSDLREQNIGSRLLHEAEKAALNRGCKYAFLDTFSFQAPNFYKKHGYKEIFTLNEYPLTGKRHYFTKDLKIGEKE